MPQIDTNPIFQGRRNKVGKPVFYRRNGEICMRSIGNVKNPKTEAPMKVHTTFTRLADTWKEIGGIMQKSWNI